MFGLGQQAKVPNSSQYDFKGASVTLKINRSNPHQAHINLHLHAQAMQAPQQEVHQEDHNQIKALDFPINYRIKPMNLKALNIERP